MVSSHLCWMSPPSVSMGWLVVWILCVFCTVVYQSLADPSSVWTSEATATEKQISPEKEVLNGQTEKPKNDTDFNSEISDAPKVHPGDYLFQLSVGMKFGANFKGFEGMEKRIGRSIKRLVIEKLSTFSSFKELFLLTIKRVHAPGLLFVYWLYFSPGTEDNYILIESRMKQLLLKSVSNLRYGKAEIFLISIEDVDECTAGLSTCDPEATCLNAFGLYSCRCPKGFDVSSGIGCVKKVKSESGFVSSLGLQEILASVILCVVLILAIMLTLLFMIKRKNKRILARNQSSDDFLPRQQTLLPQEEMRLEESLFEFDGAQNNRIFFRNSEPVEVVAGHGDCMAFKMVQKQESVESPHL